MTELTLLTYWNFQGVSQKVEAQMRHTPISKKSLNLGLKLLWDRDKKFQNQLRLMTIRGVLLFAFQRVSTSKQQSSLKWMTQASVNSF